MGWSLYDAPPTQCQIIINQYLPCSCGVQSVQKQDVSLFVRARAAHPRISHRSVATLTLNLKPVTKVRNKPPTVVLWWGI